MEVQQGMIFVEQMGIMGQIVVEKCLEGSIAISFFLDQDAEPLHYPSGIGVDDE